MKFNRAQLIDELLTDVQQQLARVTDSYMNASEGKLNQPSSDGGWSVLQCVDHLNSYGQYYLPKVEIALKSAIKPASGAYKSGWLGDYFTKIMSPKTGAKKHKAVKSHMPGSNLVSSTVLSEFLRQGRLLQSYLESARELDIGSARIPVSIAPWISLKLGDTLRFLIAHNQRHIAQAERNFKGIK